MILLLFLQLFQVPLNMCSGWHKNAPSSTLTVPHNFTDNTLHPIIQVIKENIKQHPMSLHENAIIVENLC